MPATTYTIAASADDGEEINDGVRSDTITAQTPLLRVSAASDFPYIGLRWSIPVPQGASIVSAKMQFFLNSSKAVRPNMQIAAYNFDSCAAFGTTANDLSSRAITGAQTWAPGSDQVSGQYNDTPDISPMVQNVVSRSGWVSGNYLGIRLAALSSADAWQIQTFDNPSGNAPRLVLDFTVKGHGPLVVPPPAAQRASRW